VTLSEFAGRLADVGVEPPARPWPESPLRFADGARYHFEIPSVEGPKVLRRGRLRSASASIASRTAPV
jgi:hypothetical protein